jgi:exonuclease SbcC
VGEPKGDKFMTDLPGEYVADETTIEVVNDGISISKTRNSQGKTFYSLDGEIYHKSEMPEEVTDCLCMKPIHNFGPVDFELNFVFQLDMPFLLSEAPSVGAMVLGKLANADVVDNVAKEFERQAFTARRDITTLETRIEDKNTALKKYDYVQDAILTLQNAESELAGVNVERLKTIMKLVSEYQKQIKTVGNLENELKELPDTEKLHSVASLCAVELSQFTVLRDLGDSSKVTAASLGLINTTLPEIKKVVETWLESQDCLLKINTYKVHNEVFVKYIGIIMEKTEMQKLLEKELELTKAMTVLVDLGINFDSYSKIEDLNCVLLSTKEKVENISAQLGYLKPLLKQGLTPKNLVVEDELHKVLVEIANKYKKDYALVESKNLELTTVKDDLYKQERMIQGLWVEAGTCPWCNSEVKK